MYKKYFDINGFATRSEYWGVYLVSLGLLFPFIFLATLIPMLIGWYGVVLSSLLSVGALVLLVWLYGATAARRCRDAGINPWFSLSLLLLVFMPPIGLICCIVFGCLSSETHNGK